MRPSDIDPFGGNAVPFLATFGHAESEVFAAMLVGALAAGPNEWVPIEPRAVGLWLQELTKDEREKKKWEILALARPHPHTLVKEGFCRFVGEDEKHGSIEFTGVGLKRLAAWVRK